MRKSTFLWLVLATVCGIALFHTSQKVHDERVKIAGLEQSIAKEEESLRVLNAEWGYLNQPQRLEKLSKEYLHLAPLKGGQFAKLEDIPLRAAGENVVPPPPQAEVKISKHLPPATLPLKEAIAKEQKPVAAAKPATHEKPKSNATAATHLRKFGDVMKGLGIE